MPPLFSVPTIIPVLLRYVSLHYSVYPPLSLYFCDTYASIIQCTHHYPCTSAIRKPPLFMPPLFSVPTIIPVLLRYVCLHYSVYPPLSLYFCDTYASIIHASIIQCTHHYPCTSEIRKPPLFSVPTIIPVLLRYVSLHYSVYPPLSLYFCDTYASIIQCTHHYPCTSAIRMPPLFMPPLFSVPTIIPVLLRYVSLHYSVYPPLSLYF